MVTPIDINVLANIINSGWGNSSMPTGGKVLYSVKARIVSHTIEVVYTTVIKYTSNEILSSQMQQYDNESTQRIDAYVKLMKSTYKAEMGTALPCKQRNTFANVETIGMSHHSPVKTAYYRRTVIYDM